jgi:hypothetical protein
MTDPKTVTLQFSVPAIALVLEGLEQLPLGRSRALWESINTQAQMQLAAPKVEPPTTPVKSPRKRRASAAPA